jgi:hypothetical protein
METELFLKQVNQMMPVAQNEVLKGNENGERRRILQE